MAAGVGDRRGGSRGFFFTPRADVLSQHFHPRLRAIPAQCCGSQMALGNEPGGDSAASGRCVEYLRDLEFLDSEKSDSGRTVVTTDRKAGNLVVKGVSLVAELPEIGTHRCLIKMDIEGAELEVLPALLPQLHQASVILMELHYTEKTRPKLETLLRENLWSGHMLEDNGVHSYWALSNSTEIEALIKRLR